MRLLMTTDTVGGVWTFTRELSEGVLEAGHTLVLVSFGRRLSRDQADWAERTALRWPNRFRLVETEFALEWMQDNGQFYDQAATLLSQLVVDSGADLVHSNQLCFGALRCGVPVVVTAHSDVRSWFASCRGQQPEPSPWISRYDALVGAGLRSADAVTAPTAWMLAESALRYGPLRSDSVIPNGRSLSESAGTADRVLRAVTAGRLWDEAKGMAILSPAPAGMPLLVAGDDAGPDGQQAPVEAGVQRLGYLAEDALHALMRRSWIYLATSLYEPFGLAPLEAALCGCVLVLRDLAPLREVWADAAVYFHDAEGLSRALSALAADELSRHRLAGLAQQRARSRYSRQQMVSRYLELFGHSVTSDTRSERAERDVA